MALLVIGTQIATACPTRVTFSFRNFKNSTTMLKNHFTILLRSLYKNRLLVVINILGLSTAIGCCVVAYFLYDSNASFDAIHSNASSIYRVNSIVDRLGKPTTFGFAPIPLGEAIKQ